MDGWWINGWMGEWVDIRMYVHTGEGKSMDTILIIAQPQAQIGSQAVHMV